MIIPHRLSTILGLVLLTLGTNALPQAQDAHKELQAIEKELQQEYKQLRVATKEAPDDEAAAALYREFQEGVVPEFAERFAAVARANKGTDLGLSGWTKILELASQGFSGAVASEALKTISSEHLQSPKLAAIAGSLRYSASSLGEEAVAGALRAIVAGSPHREVQASALYSLGAVLGEERPHGDPKIAEAKGVLAKLAEYQDVEYFDGRSYAEAAQSFVFALENLVVGRPCPDFAALDAEGAGFKLSDYKGKVVLVDFWGFW